MYIYRGISTESIICFIISLLVSPSISRSGVTTTRCSNTGIAASFMSSGVTKSLPFKAAYPFAAFNIAIDALGDAPKYKKPLSRVFKTTLAI